MSNERSDLYCADLAELVAGCDPDAPDPAQLAKVEEHIRGCVVCSEAETALNRTVSAYRMGDPGAVHPAFEAEMLRRLCNDDERSL